MPKKSANRIPGVVYVVVNKTRAFGRELCGAYTTPELAAKKCRKIAPSYKQERPDAHIWYSAEALAGDPDGDCVYYSAQCLDLVEFDR